MSTYIDELHQTHDRIATIALSLCNENTQVTRHTQNYEYDTSVSITVEGVPLIFDRFAACHKELRISVRPNLPKRIDGEGYGVRDLFSHDEVLAGATIPHITFAPNKTPDAIHRDLIRRMLPGARECIARANRYNDDAATQAGKVKNTFAALSQCPGVRVTTGSDTGMRASFDGNARIEHVGADRITIHTHGLPATLAIKILTLIKKES